jgi:hypothetical protein
MAAKALGVPVEYLVGLANNPIPACKVATSRGNEIWLFKKDVVMELAARIQRGRPE